MKTIEKDDEIYTLCDTLPELTEHVQEMGWDTIADFEKSTCCKAEELIGKPFTIVHNSVFLMEDSE